MVDLARPMLTKAAFTKMAYFAAGDSEAYREWNAAGAAEAFLEAQDRDALALLAAQAAAARKDEGNGYAGRPWDEVEPGVQSAYLSVGHAVVDALLGPEEAGSAAT